MGVFEGSPANGPCIATPGAQNAAGRGVKIFSPWRRAVAAALRRWFRRINLPTRRDPQGVCVGLFYPDLATPPMQGRRLDYPWGGVRVGLIRDAGTGDDCGVNLPRSMTGGIGFVAIDIIAEALALNPSFKRLVGGARLQGQNIFDVRTVDGKFQTQAIGIGNI